MTDGRRRPRGGVMSEISSLGGDVEHAARRSTEELADFATVLIGGSR